VVGAGREGGNTSWLGSRYPDGPSRWPPCLACLPHTQDASSPALAWCQLGCLRYELGQLPAAVTCFERFYELARSLDRRLLDAARANLGTARAALRLRDYMGAAEGDLPRLLRAKGLPGGLPHGG
jgi:hypothetical protein